MLRHGPLRVNFHLAQNESVGQNVIAGQNVSEKVSQFMGENGHSVITLGKKVTPEEVVPICGKNGYDFLT
jgi:hypothetical protein